MKRKILTAIIIVAAISMVGCANNKATKENITSTTVQTQQAKSNNVIDNATNTTANNTASNEVNEANNTNTTATVTNSAAVNSSKSTTTTTNNSSGSTIKNSVNSLAKVSSNYNVVKAVYKYSNITIEYPEITNLGNSAKQAQLNSLIKTSVLDGFDLTSDIKTGTIAGYNQPIADLTMNITYNIGLKNKNILSIEYLGDSNIKGSMHPNNYIYTSNIDINNVKALKLGDMFSLTPNFVTAFKNYGVYKPWYQASNEGAPSKSDITAQIYNYNDNNYMLQCLNKSDVPWSQAQNGDASGVFSYLTNDGVVISMEVSHAGGDHAEFKVPYSYVSKNIKIAGLLQ